MKKASLLLIICLASVALSAQRVPAADQNFPFLVTFGNKAEKSWGDDDFVQIFFFCVPQTSTQPIYIRVFDADAGGLMMKIAAASIRKRNFPCMVEQERTPIPMHANRIR